MLAAASPGKSTYIPMKTNNVQLKYIDFYLSEQYKVTKLRAIDSICTILFTTVLANMDNHINFLCCYDSKLRNLNFHR